MVRVAGSPLSNHLAATAAASGPACASDPISRKRTNRSGFSLFFSQMALSVGTASLPTRPSTHSSRAATSRSSAALPVNFTLS